MSLFVSRMVRGGLPILGFCAIPALQLSAQAWAPSQPVSAAEVLEACERAEQQGASDPAGASGLVEKIRNFCALPSDETGVRQWASDVEVPSPAEVRDAMVRLTPTGAPRASLPGASTILWALTDVVSEKGFAEVETWVVSKLRTKLCGDQSTVAIWLPQTCLTFSGIPLERFHSSLGLIRTALEQDARVLPAHMLDQK